MGQCERAGREGAGARDRSVEPVDLVMEVRVIVPTRISSAGWECRKV
jgi:hypothetical protein